MATFRIAAGNHYSWPPQTWPWLGPQRMERTVTFDASAAYDSPAYNGQDVNKLFGLSFGVRGIHWNSARFGWRWSAADKCIELLAYVYTYGKRNQDAQLRFPVVAQIQPGQRVRCKIEYTGTAFYFRCLSADLNIYGEMNAIAAVGLPSYGLTHGLYFGGGLPASHDMAVRIDRV